ncbi:hypothetical protein QTG54_013253 [Skeletonema marinoi]|uniref:PDZ domain-containing protein n=1 Tax=Skeletonema marinoi TaxID=267567 RepID=A0AAD8XZ35_9STRA|nr:hypothetical protein QTG54_013253 [Skeletonema marinoi]
MKSTIAILAAAALAAPSNMFCAGFSSPAVATTQRSPLTSLSMAEEDENFMRWAKQSRSAAQASLGLVLDEDDNGNVFVQTVAPRGNAARSGLVKEGDIVTMCSATFGDQMWSCRGVGLTRVLAAIRVRAGPTVSLVFENRQQKKVKGAEVARQAQAAQEARERAQAKRDQLLTELEQDEIKLKKGKFLGLF